MYRGLAPLAALLAVTAGTPSAFAGPELDRILSSAMGRFLVTETAGGKSIAAAALGRALRPGETMEALEARLNDPALREATERLESRMAKIEREFRQEYPGVGAELSVEQRATLRLLAHQDLEGMEFVAAGGRPGGFDANRRIFTAAVPTDGLRGVIRYPSGVEPFLHPDWMIQFGFESEFTMSELDGLVSVYGPAPEFGITPQAWLQMPVAERVAYVKANVTRLFPETRAMGGLVRITADPKLQFLPDRLLRDSTGNLEIVMKPVNTFEEWKQRIFLANEKLGTGSMQGTISVPSDAFFGRPEGGGMQTPATLVEADLGYFNFHNDLDTLEKLEVGASRYARSPDKPAANSFNHAFLGPMTRLKQDLLIQYLEANARGELLDQASLARVSQLDNSFKYTGGTAYRPDIVRDRVVLEVRDAHTSMDALLERMSRALVYLQDGRSLFADAARLPAFDSHADFAKLPEDVQAMLKQLFPSKMLPGVEYNAEERLALEVYRNFAYPMRDWDAQLGFLDRPELRNGVRLAQRGYSAKLAAVATELKAGRITAQRASLRVQGAVSQFSVESKLAEAYRARARQLLEQTPDIARHGVQRRPAM